MARFRSSTDARRGARTKVAVLAAIVLAALAPLSSPPASAAVQDTSWRPAAGAVPDAPFYAYIVSSSGDYIGGGKTYSYTQAATDLSLSVDGGAISLRIEGEQGWSATFVPPSSVNSVVAGGVYTDLTRYPFQDDAVGGLDFSGEGRGCNKLSGWYAIDEATYAGGDLQTLLMRFEQRCEGSSAPPLRGQIKYDASAANPPAPTPTLPMPTLWSPAPNAVPATGNSFFMASQAGDWVGKGKTWLYTDDEDISMSGGGAMLNVDIHTEDDWWYLNMAASNRADALTAGYYSALQRYPFHNPVRGGFSMSGNGAGCNQLAAWVAIDEIDLRGGQVNDVTMRYEQHCDFSTPALRGRVHWETPPSDGAPGVPTAVAAAPLTNGATVTWDAPATAGTSAITGYQVYAFEQGNIIGAPVQVGPSARSHTFSGLKPGVPHTFKVQAVNASGPGWRSPGAMSSPIDPKPVVTSLTPASGLRTGGTAVQITGANFTGATAVNLGSVSVPFTVVDTNRIDIVSPDLPAGTHAVSVTSPEGTSDEAAGAVWIATKVGPGAPTSVNGVARQRAIDATWVAPAVTGDDPISSYKVSATKSGALSAQVSVTAPAGATGIALTGLTPGATYLVKVASVTAAGTGPSATSPAITVPPIATGPFANVDALVRQQYLDFAGRAATSSETANAAAPINAGTQSPEAFIAGMRNRPEWAVRAPVVRLYAAYFDRLPDANGLTYWANKLRSGTSLSKVSATFAGSSEFQRKYGKLSNRNFVLLIYTNVLKRTPDTSGVNYWTGKLDRGMSRGAVMTNFSESSENVRKTTDAVDVVLVYAGMLRRMPTASELDDERTVLDGGAPLTDLVGRILTSPAYAARF